MTHTSCSGSAESKELAWAPRAASRCAASLPAQVLQPLLIDAVAGTACHSMHRLSNNPPSHGSPLSKSDIPFETDCDEDDHRSTRQHVCLTLAAAPPRARSGARSRIKPGRATPTDVQLSCTTVQCSRMNDLVYGPVLCEAIAIHLEQDAKFKPFCTSSNTTILVKISTPSNDRAYITGGSFCEL